MFNLTRILKSNPAKKDNNWGKLLSLTINNASEGKHTPAQTKADKVKQKFYSNIHVPKS